MHGHMDVIFTHTNTSVCYNNFSMYVDLKRLQINMSWSRQNVAPIMRSV